MYLRNTDTAEWVYDYFSSQYQPNFVQWETGEVSNYIPEGGRYGDWEAMEQQMQQCMKRIFHRQRSWVQILLRT